MFPRVGRAIALSSQAAQILRRVAFLEVPAKVKFLRKSKVSVPTNVFSILVAVLICSAGNTLHVSSSFNDFIGIIHNFN